MKDFMEMGKRHFCILQVHEAYHLCSPKTNLSFVQQVKTEGKEDKKEMLGSIVSCLASPRKILGKNFFEHSG